MAHHWILESPAGRPTVKGVCCKCQAEREYPTTGPDDRISAGWQSHIPNLRRSQATHVFEI